MNHFCQVAVNFPHSNNVLTYSFNQSKIVLSPGDIVKVSLGKRFEYGCIISLDADQALINKIGTEKVKEISYEAATSLKLTSTQIELFQWMSKYYHFPLGRLIFDCMPKFMKRPKKLNVWQGQGQKEIPPFTEEQENAYKKIRPKFGNHFDQWLIHGITGSGKSILYLKLIDEVLAKKKSVLYIVPEINLTPQFLNFFMTHLPQGTPIFLYNSELTDSDRFGLWKLLLEDEQPKLVIGVRSSVFLPIRELGLIVVDEEHDSSFKQEGRCPYHARDVAIKLASMCKIPILLGSATPSLETFFNFNQKKKENYIPLRLRANKASLPEIVLEDLKKSNESINPKEFLPLTTKCIDEIRKAFARNEQALVFINRLGFANYLQCPSCAHQFTCKNCTTTLRYFKARKSLSCSYCEFSTPVPESCPECQCLGLLRIGYGTEKVCDILQSIFTDKKIARFDRDEIKNFEQLNKVLDDFHSGKTDLLVGTQMLSKGHNFEKVNLVIILGMDSLLNFSDFRAGEKAYQLISQVAGRSGRFGKSAKVILPTLCEDNPVFKHVQNNSFTEFHDEELSMRQELNYPPFSKLALLEFSDKNQEKVRLDVLSFTKVLRELQQKGFESVSILGPRPSLIEKKANKFSWIILLKSSDINKLHNFLNTIKSIASGRKLAKFKVDIDPQNLL